MLGQFKHPGKCIYLWEVCNSMKQSVTTHKTFINKNKSSHAASINQPDPVQEANSSWQNSVLEMLYKLHPKSQIVLNCLVILMKSPCFSIFAPDTTKVGQRKPPSPQMPLNTKFGWQINDEICLPINLFAGDTCANNLVRVWSVSLERHAFPLHELTPHNS